MSAEEKHSQQSHSSEEAIMKIRAAKAEAVRERGENPFANDVNEETLVDIGLLRRRFDIAKTSEGKYEPAQVESIAKGESAHIAGRIVASRTFGKASFVRLRDRAGEIQLFCRADKLGEAYGRLEELDIGDFIEARGLPMVTRTGELSIEAESFRLLTKTMRPLPEKWHGLTDIETRYRQRYVDLVANPEVREVFAARSVIIREIRQYLDNLGFLEVETPSMHTLVGGAAAKPFETYHNALGMKLFMRIAPELYLKRLVVGGFERVYEIGRNYRNEGISTRHNPEFTMLEFYRAFATYETIMAMNEELLRSVDRGLAEKMPEAHAKWREDRAFTFDEPFARVPMKEAVARALEEANLPGDVIDVIRHSGDQIKAWAASSERARRIDWGNFRKGMQKCDSDGEALFVAYEYLAEPFLPEDYRSQDGKKSLPVFIIDYPFEVSPLARRKDSDPSLVDRFELFVHGRELCNAFSELNDPEDQAERFRSQVERKERGDEEAMDYDEDYIRALEHGMPPTAGFGMGIDRLVMMLTCQPSIRDVILFPLLRPERS